MCFGTRGVVLCNSRDVKIVQDAGSIFNAGGKGNETVGGKKGYIYSSSCDFLVLLVRYGNFDSYPAFCWLMNTKQPTFHVARPPGTSWMRSLETRFCTPAAESLRRPASLLHVTPLSQLRPCESRSTLHRSQVVITVQPSITATDTPGGGNSTRN